MGHKYKTFDNLDVASSQVENVVQDIEVDRTRVSKSQFVLDFANVFKAFIGANYLTISYSFSKSGIGLGIGGLALIATLTDFCCHVIIKCKYAATEVLMKKVAAMTELTHEQLDDDDKAAIKHRIVRNMQYGDIGMVAIGRPGRILVDVFIWLTQFGFSVAYFIFLGNTFAIIFACQHMPLIPLHNSSNVNQTLPPTDQSDSFEYVHKYVALKKYSSLVNTSQNTPLPTHIISAVSSCLPPLALLVLTPLPVFIPFALFRHVRQLGIVSILANISIFGGLVCMICYLCINFSITHFNWSSLSTFPFFMGAVTSAYEGIGTLIPIESSMEGNRKNFSAFLHCAILGLSALLLVLGILGYLRFGSDVAQMLNLNIPSDTQTLFVISKFIDTTLCVGILLTFPLQIFPVIELLETYLFTEGMILGPKNRSGSSSSDSTMNENIEDSALINSQTKPVELGFTVATPIPRSIPTWQRNVLRVITVLLAAGVAVLCRNIYAYVSAFVGAVGSTMLAYILPCVFQIYLCKSTMPVLHIIRNILIIIFGFCASILSLYSIVQQLVTGDI